MYRGTTPTVALTVDGMDLTELSSLYITFRQNEGSLTPKTLTKQNGDDGVFVTSDTVTVKLTQADTLGFRPGTVQVQLRGLMPDGTAVASSIKNFPAWQILLEGEIQ